MPYPASRAAKLFLLAAIITCAVAFLAIILMLAPHITRIILSDRRAHLSQRAALF
jgi:hypothetical protein